MRLDEVLRLKVALVCQNLVHKIQLAVIQSPIRLSYGLALPDQARFVTCRLQVVSKFLLTLLVSSGLRLPCGLGARVLALIGSVYRHSYPISCLFIVQMVHHFSFYVLQSLLIELHRNFVLFSLRRRTIPSWLLLRLRWLAVTRNWRNPTLYYLILPLAHAL